MKKQTIFIASVFTLLFTIFLNQLILLEYSMNIVTYIGYQLALTETQSTQGLEQEPLIFGGNISEPPLGLTETESGQSVGLVIDYVNAISIQMGVPIVVKPMVWSDSLDALSKGETDLCDLIPSEERQRHFLFSRPLYNLKGIAVTKSGQGNIQKISDLNGKRIGAQRGDIAIEILRRQAPQIQLMETENVEQALELLDSGRVDAVLGDEPVIWYYIKELSKVSQYKILSEPIYDESCVIAVPKGREDLLLDLNRAIFELRKNGTLSRINEKWSAYSPMLSKNLDGAKLKVLLLMLMSLLGALISFAIILNMQLKNIINDKTKELQFTFDSLSSFMIIMDGSQIITNINRAFLNYLKQERESLIGLYAMDLPILRAVLQMEGLSSELFFENRYYEVKREPKMIFMKDITLEKIKTEQLMHSNRIEAIGQLASGVAHELRNPLGVIRNSTFLLKDIAVDQDPIAIRAVKSIDQAVMRASQIIDKLLNFARVDRQEVGFVELWPLIHETIEYFKVANQHKNLNFCFECSEDITFNTEEQALRHAMINLIGNACDAIDAVGDIKISCQMVEENWSRFLVIAVEDTGSGIEKQTLGRIFDPFFTTKAPGEGTGLGLYIVTTELRKIRGHVEVDSVVGEGSRFVVKLKELTEGESHGK